MGRQAYINKSVSISEIRKVKRDLQKFVDLYEKVTFIEKKVLEGFQSYLIIS